MGQHQPSKEDPELRQRQAVVKKLQRIAVEDMKSARILVNAHPYEQLFYLTPKECEQLRNIISHSEAVPPAKGKPQVIFVSYPSFETLVLLDNQGREYDLPMLARLWMKKSEADALAEDRMRRSDEPHWCLPDEDYAALQALPTLRQARLWAKLHSQGSALVIPNSPEPPPQPAAPEEPAPQAEQAQLAEAEQAAS